METDTALVGTDSVVELHTVADIVLDLSLVVNPCHAECENTIRLNHTLDDTGFFVFRMLVVNVFYAKKNFFHCLEEFLLSGMLGLKIGQNLINIHVNQFRFRFSC